eukprot:gene675-412_t
MPATYGGSSGSAQRPPQIIPRGTSGTVLNTDGTINEANVSARFPNTVRDLSVIGLPWVRIDFPFVTNSHVCRFLMATGTVTLSGMIPGSFGNITQAVVAASWVSFVYSPRITAISWWDQICGTYTVVVLAWVHLPSVWHQVPDWVIVEYIIFVGGFMTAVGLCGLFVERFEYLIETSRMPEVIHDINLLPIELEENLQEVEQRPPSPKRVSNDIVPAGLAAMAAKGMINSIGFVKDRQAVDPHISVLRKLVRNWKVSDAGGVNPTKLSDIVANVVKIHAKDRFQIEARSHELLGDRSIFEAVGDTSWNFMSSLVSSETVRTARWVARWFDSLFPEPPFVIFNPTLFRQVICLWASYVVFRVTRKRDTAILFRAAFASGMVIRFYRDLLLPSDSDPISNIQKADWKHKAFKFVGKGLDVALAPIRWLTPDAWSFSKLVRQLGFLAAFEIFEHVLPRINETWKKYIPKKYRILRRLIAYFPVPYYIFVRYVINLIHSIPRQDGEIDPCPKRQDRNIIMSFFAPTISSATGSPRKESINATVFKNTLHRLNSPKSPERNARATPIPSARASPIPSPRDSSSSGLKFAKVGHGQRQPPPVPQLDLPAQHLRLTQYESTALASSSSNQPPTPQMQTISKETRLPSPPEDKEHTPSGTPRLSASGLGSAGLRRRGSSATQKKQLQ